MTYLAKVHLLSGRSLKSYIYFILCSYWIGYKDIQMPLGFFFFFEKREQKTCPLKAVAFQKKLLLSKLLLS